jgi:hypothetical protein
MAADLCVEQTVSTLHRSVDELKEQLEAAERRAMSSEQREDRSQKELSTARRRLAGLHKMQVENDKLSSIVRELKKGAGGAGDAVDSPGGSGSEGAERSSREAQQQQRWVDWLRKEKNIVLLDKRVLGEVDETGARRVHFLISRCVCGASVYVCGVFVYVCGVFVYVCGAEYLLDNGAGMLTKLNANAGRRRQLESSLRSCCSEVLPKLSAVADMSLALADLGSSLGHSIAASSVSRSVAWLDDVLGLDLISDHSVSSLGSGFKNSDDSDVNNLVHCLAHDMSAFDDAFLARMAAAPQSPSRSQPHHEDGSKKSLLRVYYRVLRKTNKLCRQLQVSNAMAYQLNVVTSSRGVIAIAIGAASL